MTAARSQHSLPSLQRPKSTYAVTARNAAPNEPPWVVFVEGQGASAEAVAHFYREEEAQEYAKWRNSGQKKSEKSI